MSRHAIVLHGVEEDVGEETRKAVIRRVRDMLWENQFAEPDEVEWDARPLAAVVGDFVTDAGGLTAHERGVVEEAAYLIAREENDG